MAAGGCGRRIREEFVCAAYQKRGVGDQREEEILMGEDWLHRGKVIKGRQVGLEQGIRLSTVYYIRGVVGDGTKVRVQRERKQQGEQRCDGVGQYHRD